MTAVLSQARAVADAVLYEGYVLYPYRASAPKNRARWQWGVLVPPGHADLFGEASSTLTEVLLEADGGARVSVHARWLQVQHRSGGALPTWDEGVEREVMLSATIDELLAGTRQVRSDLPAHEDVEDGADGPVTRRRWPVQAAVAVTAERLEGPYGLVRLRVEVRNTTGDALHAATRDESVRQALIGAHALLACSAGGFVSLLDPPEWAAPAAAACRNERTWPVLVAGEGGRDVVLSSPIILGDHPEIAAESPGDWCDALEIDELLALRTVTLTDEEKAAARATDPRAAAILDRAEALDGDLEGLHGAIRGLAVRRPGAGRVDAVPVFGEPAGTDLPPHPEGAAVPGQAPWWDPAADRSVDPSSDAVHIAGVRVARGSEVRLAPGGRRSDAQDLFLVGRTATVEAVVHDVDGEVHVAVTLADDPEAAEIARWHGRYLYFHPDELTPVGAP